MLLEQAKIEAESKSVLLYALKKCQESLYDALWRDKGVPIQPAALGTEPLQQVSCMIALSPLFFHKLFRGGIAV